MHQSSYEKMVFFKTKFLKHHIGNPVKILDLGSQDINGSYKPIFTERNWTYHGLDIVKGKNVDIVLDNIYFWKEVKNASYDVVISGQVFEHMEFFWLAMLEITRVLKNNGLCCIIAPSSGPEHRYPVDCYRFYTDGMIALAKFAKLEVLHAETEWDPLPYDDYSAPWKDTILVAQKNRETIFRQFARNVQHSILHFWVKKSYNT